MIPQEIIKALGAQNLGYLHERTEHSELERAFLQEWQKENEPHPFINYGNGILQDLFMQSVESFPRLATCVHEVTDEERFVAATVIQWLGSNCGFAFLGNALKHAGFKIERIEKSTP